jgi:hypothetical protein
LLHFVSHLSTTSLLPVTLSSPWLPSSLLRFGYHPYRKPRHGLVMRILRRSSGVCEQLPHTRSWTRGLPPISVDQVTHGHSPRSHAQAEDVIHHHKTYHRSVFLSPEPILASVADEGVNKLKKSCKFCTTLKCLLQESGMLNIHERFRKCLPCPPRTRIV